MTGTPRGFRIFQGTPQGFRWGRVDYDCLLLPLFQIYKDLLTTQSLHSFLHLTIAVMINYCVLFVAFLSFLLVQAGQHTLFLLISI